MSVPGWSLASRNQADAHVGSQCLLRIRTRRDVVCVRRWGQRESQRVLSSAECALTSRLPQHQLIKAHDASDAHRRSCLTIEERTHLTKVTRLSMQRSEHL